LTRVANSFSDFDNINRIVITLSVGIVVENIGIFPSLGKSTIVPDVTLVGEAVANKSGLTLLDILLDRV
jgi:hypothetical protein